MELGNKRLFKHLGKKLINSMGVTEEILIEIWNHLELGNKNSVSLSLQVL